MAEEGILNQSYSETTTIEENNNNNNNHTDFKKENVIIPKLFSCLLQPATIDSDPDYIVIRRLLLFRKAKSGVHRRLEWRCNGKGYVAYRNYIRRPRNWELQTPSHQSTPGTSGRWIPSSSPLSLLYEVDSWSSSRDL